jgi:hypothetical protein
MNVVNRVRRKSGILKKTLLPSAFAVLVLLIVPPNVYAENTGRISINVSESTCVDRDNVWANFGSLGWCFVGKESQQNPSLPRYYAFFKFNLTSIPSGVTIESAYFQIYPGSAHTVPPYYEVSAYYCSNNNWQENSLNFFNAPWDYVSSGITDTASWTDLGQTVVLDVKSDVLKSLSSGMLTEVLAASPSVWTNVDQHALLNVTWDKIPTNVTLSLPKSLVTKNENFAIWGIINPVLQSQMTLRFIKPDLTSFNSTVTAGPDGRFNYTLVPDQIGTWQVTAFWNGTAKYSSCFSDTLSFTVTEPQTPPSLPGTDYTPIVSGVIIASIVILATTSIWLWRKRRLKGLSRSP